MDNDDDEVIAQLVLANRILANEGILDAYGHVSVRDPADSGIFLLSRARSPQEVEAADIQRYRLDGSPVQGEGSAIAYIERFIHAAIYEARPDVTAICHNHAASILPFSISTSTSLSAVIHTARFIGASAAVWDAAEQFGDETDLLVRDLDMGRSLARTLSSASVALMRGHGSVVVGTSPAAIVSMCIGMDQNARTQLAAATLGGYRALAAGETTEGYRLSANGDNRAWAYFTARLPARSGE